MTDNTSIVDLPWYDGTTRTVPEFTPYVERAGVVAFARDGGYSYRASSDSRTHPHDHDSAAVCILTEAPEPPVKVEVPTGIGAIVSGFLYPDKPTFVLDQQGWRGLHIGARFDSRKIADALRSGARVLYEGVDESLDQ